ncbi:5-amino-6-(5-phospho-D-ribitylamino)uracil phosphatase YigB [Candidatus Steffania adelgidicola]|uniref:5-amino-6-(5-phospho-D-ribitylamino)uracil phosphatase YigB n=1 Tax=Candidatus Steffania adelgidicola TaxID=1076626 RepID=UPI001D014CBE|nr:5-amino-6-(5-phospho-D-ribitylamino)uracil phosphatase YigB [Candidatus Steffania adelgidicola]UDG80064.1 5-amino-6-(5-phospho-D-ribitylamino)uracil phosphatase YigB [Candidatus Steffania adelgidicola]
MYFYRPLRQIRAFTFDLDDTLYDNRPVITRTEYESLQFLKRYHPALRNLEQEDYKRFRYELRQREPEICHDVGKWRRCSMELAMCNAGLSQKEARIGANVAMEVVLCWRSQIDVPAETHYTLSALSARWPLVAISNGNASLSACGLAGYFRYILYAGQAGRAKPYPDMFYTASELLNVPLQSILHVGDNLETDIIGAICCSMQACWINDRGANIALVANTRLLPHLEISRLASLMDFL